MDTASRYLKKSLPIFVGTMLLLSLIGLKSNLALKLLFASVETYCFALLIAIVVNCLRGNLKVAIWLTAGIIAILLYGVFVVVAWPNPNDGTVLPLEIK